MGLIVLHWEDANGRVFQSHALPQENEGTATAFLHHRLKWGTPECKITRFWVEPHDPEVHVPGWRDPEPA